MASSSHRRLRRELKLILSAETPGLYVQPLESNMLEWHFCFEGEDDTDYAGGVYWGKLEFPSTYPLNAPNVYMLTPNGRFQTGKALCLMGSTGYHNEAWSPSTTILSLLLGLRVSMRDDGVGGIGALRDSEAQRQSYATQSRAWNLRHETFVSSFGEHFSISSDKEPPIEKGNGEEQGKETEGGQKEAKARDVDEDTENKDRQDVVELGGGFGDLFGQQAEPEQAAERLAAQQGNVVLLRQPAPTVSLRELKRILSVNGHRLHMIASDGHARELKKLAYQTVDWCCVDTYGRNAVSKAGLRRSVDILFLVVEMGVPHLHHGPLAEYRRHHVGVLHPHKGLLEDIAFHGEADRKQELGAERWAAKRSEYRQQLAAALEKHVEDSTIPPPLSEHACATVMISSVLDELRNTFSNPMQRLSALCALADQALSGSRRANYAITSGAIKLIEEAMAAYNHIPELAYHGLLAMYELVLRGKDTNARQHVVEEANVMSVLTATATALQTVLSNYLHVREDRRGTLRKIAHLACRLMAEESIISAHAVVHVLVAHPERCCIIPLVIDTTLGLSAEDNGVDIRKMALWFFCNIFQEPSILKIAEPLVSAVRELAQFFSTEERAAQLISAIDKLSMKPEDVSQAMEQQQWHNLLPWLGKSDIRHDACRGHSAFIQETLDSAAELAHGDERSKPMLYLLLQDLHRPDADGKHVCAAAASSGNVAICDTLIVLVERGVAFKYHALPPHYGRHHVDNINRGHDQFEELASISEDIQRMSAEIVPMSLLKRREELIAELRSMYAPPKAKEDDDVIQGLVSRVVPSVNDELVSYLKDHEQDVNEPCATCAEPLVVPSEEDENMTVAVVRLPCSHHIHLPCLKEWVLNNRASCPVCDKAVPNAWGKEPRPPPAGLAQMLGVQTAITMIKDCFDDAAIVAQCCRMLTDQALTSSRRTLQIIEHDGLALFDRITRHHEDDAGVVYYTLYCCYEIALGSKSTQVKKKLENQDVVAQLLRIGTHCLARAVAADMQRPWQDVAEMASRLMTEMTICAPTHVVKHLVSLENQQAGATINTVDVIAATLRKYAEIEHVEKFAFWFLLAVYRAQRKTGKDVDLINIQRWHQMLVPLIDLRAEHEPKAQELKQLLAPHVKLATRELVQDKSKGQGQSNSAVGEPVVYRQKGVSLLRQLAEACKADELAVAINAALIMEAAGLLSGDASLALEQDELEAHLRILEDLHWHNHEGLTVLLRLARHKPSPKLAAKLADTVFVLLERGAVLSCFSSWSTTELATCEIAALLTNVADGLTFPLTQAPKKQHSKPSSPSPSSPSVSSSSPAATPSSGQPAAAPIVQSAAEQAERRLRALSAVRTVFGVVPATTLPPPPPEIDGELCVHAVAQLLKMLERDRALPASQLQADKMGMRLIALADQIVSSRLRAAQFLKLGGMLQLGDIVSVHKTVAPVQLHAARVIYALMTSLAESEAELKSCMMDSFLAVLCILENAHQHAGDHGWQAATVICSDVLAKIGAISRRFSSVQQVVDQLKWLSQRVQEPQAPQGSSSSA